MNTKKQIKRIALIKRKTREVDISGRINLDGNGAAKIKTLIPFLDHMLDLFAFHGFFDLELKVKSDLTHHGIEDIAIAIGDALAKSLNLGRGIKRYGFAYVPMDKTLVRLVIDISGRPALHMEESLSNIAAAHTITPLTGKEEFSFEDLHHFLEAFCQHAKMTLHIDYRYDADTHHLCEAIFKALAIALDSATTIDMRRKGVSSTKGVLDI